MSVDVATYRARIGSFMPKAHAISGARTSSKCLCINIGLSGTPRVFVAVSVVMLLLSCAGDVESNPGPGPTNAEKIDKLQMSIESLIASSNKYQNENTRKLDEINSGITNLGCRVTRLETKMDEIASIPEKITSLTSSVALVERETTSLQNQLRVLNDTVDDLSDRMRRNNLIFKGIPETDNETSGDAQAIVKDFVERNLQIPLGAVERAHRLGQKRPGANRPIIAKFLSYKSKEEILHNASKLKNVASPKVRISEDFSPRTRLSRQKLWEFASQYREQGIRYKIAHDKLHADNRTFVFNHATNSVTQIRGDRGARITSN